MVLFTSSSTRGRESRLGPIDRKVAREESLPWTDSLGAFQQAWGGQNQQRMERHEETTTRSQCVLRLYRLVVPPCRGTKPCNGAECRVAVPYGRAARAAGGTSRTLSGSGALSDVDGFDLSIGGGRGRSLGAEQSGSRRPGAGRCDAKATVGSQRQVADGNSTNNTDDE